MSSPSLKYFIEFICTFFLVLTIHWVISLNQQYGPFLIGVILCGLVYISGPISRAHLNPASTLLFIGRKGIRKKDILPYLLAIVSAALLATYLSKSYIITGFQFIGSFDLLDIIVAEFIGTTALMSVIAYVALIDKTDGNWYYGAAIAGIVLIGILVFGFSSFASFNPAVTLSFMLTGICTNLEGAVMIITELAASIFSIFLFSRFAADYTVGRVA
jgi:aquaporin Z